MTSREMLPESVLRRKAVVYVRQSTPTQVQANLESQRRQYDLADAAKARGFRDVEVIDDDLGRSASGTVERPGFERLVAELCAGAIGAVFCLEASRLARNGREWHHILEICGLVDARVVDLDGIYDPRQPNDRLLLGMKGTISEFELGILRARLFEAARAKARRGELRIRVPIGFTWERDAGVTLDPDSRVQEVVHVVFRKFEELGSARQVFAWMRAQGLSFPQSSDGRRTVSLDWSPVRYGNVLAILNNPFYAGVYAYGKSEVRTEVVDGRAHKSYGRAKPMEGWEVFIQDHHVGYLSWAAFERNQARMARNAFGRTGGPKSGRGGRALLAGLLMCGRCGRRLHVVYTGKSHLPKYRCDRTHEVPGKRCCMGFSGCRPEQVVVEAVLRAVQPAALLAAREAERMREQQDADRRRIVELELEQARYEAGLAERRYAACDPENRLVAPQLEKAWDAALQRVRSCEERLAAATEARPPTFTEDLGHMAQDLRAAWDAPGTTMRTRQQLVRMLVEDIVADVDEASREIVLVIHWKGGQHTEVRAKRPRNGEHRRRTSEEAGAVIRSMAGKWSDEHIAACLNRMGLRTGHDNSWTARRVEAWRMTYGVRAYRPAEGTGEWLTMTQAAAALGVSNDVIRRLIRTGILAAEQVAACAPWQIRAEDLRRDTVLASIRRNRRPCGMYPPGSDPLFSGLPRGGAE